MDEKSLRHGKYVGQVREDTQRYVKEILQENEKLRVLANSLENDNARLQQQMADITAEIARHQDEQALLRKQLAQIEQESRRFSEQFEEVEQRNLNLANLYVSSYQLHGTLDREAVVSAIKEILVNLVGSEEMGIFQLASDGDTLELVGSVGIDETKYSALSLSRDPLGRLAASGETFLSAASGARHELSPVPVVCLPLKLDGRVTGLIVLFSLLAHKPALQDLDLELFDLLGSHAATALYCTSLYVRKAAEVQA